MPQPAGAVNTSDNPAPTEVTGGPPTNNPSGGIQPPAGGQTNTPSTGKAATGSPGAGDNPETNVKNQNTVHINRDQIGQQIINNYGGKFEKETIKEALFSVIKEELPPGPATTCEFDPTALDSNLDNLQEQHLILIGCSYLDFALDAAYKLIERLAQSNGDQKFRIDLQQHLTRYTISSASFLPDNHSASGKVVVLVNARDAGAQRELDKLISDADRARSFQWKLEQRGVYLLCIVQSGYIEERLRDTTRELKSPHWKIPFLEPLLKMHFSSDEYFEVKQRILDYQAKGRWPDESACYSEIMTGLKSGQLRPRIQKWDDPPEVLAKEIFRDDNHIIKSVLYLATYFRYLSPNEFSRMIEALLGERTETVAVREYSQGAGNSNDTVHTKTEMPLVEKLPLVEKWRDARDEIMWKFLRETYSSKDSIKVIDFCDYRLRDDLKHLMESERKFFVKSQFRTLHKHGFLFYNSDRVAENMIRLTCEMMVEYPDEFDKEWLFEITAATKACFDPECDLDAQPGAAVIQSLKRTTPGALNLVYSRIAELMSQLLKDPQTKVLVARCLDDLLRSGHHDTLLQLIRRLRVSSEIDDLYWIKRLLDNGDRGAQLKAFYYLYGHVKRSGIGILEPVNIVDKWLPKEERKVEQYPRSSRYALRSIVQYCLETVAELDLQAYGAWPSQYPLFAFASTNDAESGFHRLMRWLFHPAQQDVLQQLNLDIGIEGALTNPNRLAGALIAEWYFMLLGPPAKTTAAAHSGNRLEAGESAGKKTETEISPPDFDAATLTDILLKQVTKVADKDQQKEMLDYWEDFRRDLRDLILIAKLSGDVRPQLVWRNNRLWELIKTMKSLA